MSIDNTIHDMIASALDDAGFVTGMEAEQYTDGEVNDMRADMEGELTELQHRIEALEEKALEAAPAAVDPEPRAVNQIEWLMGIGSDSVFAGFDTMETLEEYVRSSMVADNKGDRAAQANMVITMTLATARNLINQKLEAES